MVRDVVRLLGFLAFWLAPSELKSLRNNRTIDEFLPILSAHLKTAPSDPRFQIPNDNEIVEAASGEYNLELTNISYTLGYKNVFAGVVEFSSFNPMTVKSKYNITNKKDGSVLSSGNFSASCKPYTEHQYEIYDDYLYQFFLDVVFVSMVRKFDGPPVSNLFLDTAQFYVFDIHFPRIHNAVVTDAVNEFNKHMQSATV